METKLSGRCLETYERPHFLYYIVGELGEVFALVAALTPGACAPCTLGTENEEGHLSARGHMQFFQDGDAYEFFTLDEKVPLEEVRQEILAELEEEAGR